MGKAKPKGLIARWIRFFTHDLWRLDSSDLSRGKRWVVDTARTGVIVVRGFIEDHLMVRAAALTYSTLLALVPFFAICFSLIKGLGAQGKVEAWLVEKFATTPGLKNTITEIFKLVGNVSLKTLGAVGLVFLILSIISMIGNVEKSLNTIWGIKVGRGFLRRIADYLSAILLGPLILLATITLTSAITNPSPEFAAKVADVPVIGWIFQTLGQELTLLGILLPYFMMWALFTFLYLYLPNTQVRFRAALLAGLFSGVGWQVMQWSYVKFQIGVVKYDAIYGTLAQLPLLMVWIFMSWVIFLLGAEIAFAIQNIKTYTREHGGEAYSFADKEGLTLRLMIEIARKFTAGEGHWTAQGLAEAQNAPLRLVNEILYELKEGGLLAEAREEGETRFLLARDLDAIGVMDILEVLRQHSEEDSTARRDPFIAELQKKLAEGRKRALADLSLRKALQESMNKK